MNDHPCSIWSILAAKHGGPARARERRSDAATARLRVRQRTNAMQGLQATLDDFETREGLNSPSASESARDPPKSLFSHLVRKGRPRDLDRARIHGRHRRRMYTTNPLPGMSHSSWNRQDPILLCTDLEPRAPPVMPGPEVSTRLLLDPVTWDNYRSYTENALDQLQTDAVQQTRAQELRRLRTAQSLDFLAVDEALESRRQWNGQKWGDFRDSLRHYTTVPRGAAPGRTFNDQMAIVDASVMARDLYHEGDVQGLFYKEGGGGAGRDSADSGSGAQSQGGSSSNTDQGAPDHHPATTAKTYPENYLPTPHALQRPWHNSGADLGAIGGAGAAGEVGGAGAIHQCGAAAPGATTTLGAATGGVTMKTKHFRTKDDVLVEYPDPGSIVHEPYRSVLVKLWHMTRLRKTSVLKFFKTCTRTEHQAHGLLPAAKLHFGLHKLLVVDRSWTFRQTMEFVYYLRKFQFRLDGGEHDEGFVDLRLLDTLVVEIGREREQAKNAFLTVYEKMPQPDRTGKTLRFAEELIDRKKRQKQRALMEAIFRKEKSEKRKLHQGMTLLEEAD
eukprot:g3863.t1